MKKLLAGLLLALVLVSCQEMLGPAQSPVQGSSAMGKSCPSSLDGMLSQVNLARAEGRFCGETWYNAAPALASVPQLDQAAFVHSANMANYNFFAHEGLDESSVADRVTDQGYAWQRVGENLAAGQRTISQAVNGWLQSPGHCKNLMNPNFQHMGAACVTNPDADYGIYWTQVLATPR